MSKSARDYQAAVAAAAEARRMVGVWVDDVRQAAEARLGIGPTDERALEDPDYRRALDATGAVEGLVRALDALADVADRTANAPAD